MSSREQSIIKQVLSSTKGVRTPNQKNLPFQTDAEIIEHAGEYLAITTDTIDEEITRGVVKTAKTIGYWSVIMSLSDLAAVGARPLGVVISVTLPKKVSAQYIRELQAGINQALITHNTFLLGGDTNLSESHSITTTALGFCPKKKFNKRANFKIGDPLFIAGTVGNGNLLALINTSNLKPSLSKKLEQKFRPTIDFELGEVITKFSGSAIDTSDGLIATMDAFIKLSKYGLQINLEQIPFAAGVQKMAKEMKLNPLLFACAEIGDYGLLFTIPKENAGAFCQWASKRKNIKNNTKNEIVEIGRVINNHTLLAKTLKGSVVSLNFPQLKNTLDSSTTSEEYLAAIVRHVQQLG